MAKVKGNLELDIAKLRLYTSSPSVIEGGFHYNTTDKKYYGSTDGSNWSQIGGSTGAGFYKHVQSSGSTTWNVAHNLGQKYVSVTVVDSSDDVIQPDDISYTDNNNLVITLSSSITGNAIIIGGTATDIGSFYEHTQSVSSATWTITHNLGNKFVNITLYDSSDQVIEDTSITSITATDANTTTVVLGGADTGTAVVTTTGGLPSTNDPINVQATGTDVAIQATTTGSGNLLQLGSSDVVVDSNGILSLANDTNIGATKKLLFDGSSGTTYMLESSPHVLDTYINSVNILKLSDIKATITGTVIAESLKAKVVGTSNLSITAITTTDSNDTLKITSADGTALSSSNIGIVTMQDDSGSIEEFEVTSDVTILVTGAHYGIGGTGNITDAILQVLALNDGGTLKWGIAYQIGRQIIGSTLDSTTPTDINLPEEVLVNSGLSNNSTALEAFWCRANFNDTGDIWSIQTGIGDLNYGSSNGQVQDWNPTFSGFSSDPNLTHSKFSQVGELIYVDVKHSGPGTSNATSFSMTLPIKSGSTSSTFLGQAIDNGSGQTIPALIQTASSGSTTLNIYKDMGQSLWTSSGGKASSFNIVYKAL